MRVDLAAAYRLVAYYGWDDLIFTHLSARVPGSEHHFLINPYGMMFEEITASSLVKVNLDGEKVGRRPILLILRASQSIAPCMPRVRMPFALFICTPITASRYRLRKKACCLSPSSHFLRSHHSPTITTKGWR